MSGRALQKLLIGIGSVITIFLVDAFFELGRIGPIPIAYVVTCIATLWFLESRTHMLVVAALTSVLITSGYFLAPAVEHTDAVVLDHITSIFSIWLAVVIGIRFRHASEKDAEHAKQLSSLFVNSTEGILFTDRSGLITAVNPACEKMFGYEPGEMAGMVIEKLMNTRYVDSHRKKRDLFFTNPHSRPMGQGREFSAQRKDGSEFPVEIGLSHFQTDSHGSAVAFIHDITERKRWSDNLRLQAEHLERLVRERTSDLTHALAGLETANQSLEHEIEIRNQAFVKLQEAEAEVRRTLEKERELNSMKSKFVTMASHEFRTPLTTILSSSFLLKNYQGDNFEKFKSNHLSRIERSVKTVTQLLDDFLSLGKLDEGKVKPAFAAVELKAFINDLITDIYALRKEGQTIHVSLSNADEIINTDRRLLSSVVTNLLANALKYSPENSSIEFRIRQTPALLEFEVQDAGIGIPESEQRHIFKRFYRANNAANIGGTGLGLNIARKYVRLMKGIIGFDSKLSEGTTFWVRLPLTVPKPASYPHPWKK